MINLSDLKDHHKGSIIAVLGAGPSLPGDMERLPAAAVRISVNHHASRLTVCDYVAFLDNPEERPDLSRLVHRMGAHHLRVGPWPAYSDIDFNVPWWNAGFTAGFAAWLACYMGGDPVLLCGMDCFQGDEKYFYKIDGRWPREHPCHGWGLDQNIAGWERFRSNTNCHVRAASGPLVELFGRWEG